jgi:hypothetical protein
VPVTLSGSIGAIVAAMAGLVVITVSSRFIREKSYHVVLTDASQIIRDNVSECRPTPHLVYGYCPRSQRRSA